MKLLIVDDEINLADLLSDFFLKKEYEVFYASTGREALAVCNNEKFDIALVDMKIPDISGFEITSNLKKISPDCVVILMTGYPYSDSDKEAMKNGASEYILKPFSLNDLWDLIVKYFGEDNKTADLSDKQNFNERRRKQHVPDSSDRKISEI
ncbi:MAG: two-component system response regulator [Candidatus Cloacimonadota bacterium]|nr:MAG: two-component system response regulator [Candidatus Cloacimonadota bacterium]